MISFKGKLLSTTVVPMVALVAGIGVAGAALSGGGLLPQAHAACAPANPCNPCAAKNPCNPCAAAACDPCNPCAVKLKAAACNPCNPCAAKNPCAAAACNPCNPCAAKKN